MSGYDYGEQVLSLQESNKRLERDNKHLRNLLREVYTHIGKEYQAEWPDQIILDDLIDRVRDEIRRS